MIQGMVGGVIINEKVWKELVKPRTRITMSMVMAANGDRCATCGKDLVVRDDGLMRW